MMAKSEIINGYYEGPRKNQYDGWTDEEINEDLKNAEKENSELKSWPRM
jgi:hypothetical protein